MYRPPPEISTIPNPEPSDPDDDDPITSRSELEALLESDPALLSQIEALERDRLDYFCTYGVIRDDKGDVDQCSQNTERNRGLPRPLIIPNENPFKGPGYDDRINKTMDPHYVGITMKQFRKRFAPGSGLSEGQRKNIVSIKPLRAITSKAVADRKKIEADKAATTKTMDQRPSRDRESTVESSGRVGVHSTESPSVASANTNGVEPSGSSNGPKGETSTPKPKSGPRLEDPMYPIIVRACFTQLRTS